MNSPTRQLLITCLIGALGGAAAAALGLPAAALTGSALAVSLAAWAGAPMRMDDRLRNTGFAIIGTSLGAGITPDFLDDLAAMPLSLALLCVSILVTLLAAAAILVRACGLDRATAIPAASPGTLSYAIAIATEGPGDERAVLSLQSMRLLLIATGLPLVLFLSRAAVGTGPAAAPQTLPWAPALILIAAALALGWLGLRIRLPAACMLAGMGLSGGLHGAGIVEGALPAPLVFAGFVVTGASVGARFSGIPAADLRRFAVAAVAIVSVSAIVSALFAAITARAIGVPFIQAWVAFAPGGIETMAAMALALGLDPGYVATHHVARILFLIAILPPVLRLAGVRNPPE